MTAKDLNEEPVFAPGHMMSELARNSFRIARGPDLASAAGLTGGTAVTTTLFNVPANTYVKAIILDVTNKWATSTGQAFTVGDSSDVDRFFTTSAANPYAVGTKTSERSVTAVAGAGGYFYTTSKAIKAISTTSTKATATGHLHSYIIYVPNIEYFDVAS